MTNDQALVKKNKGDNYPSPHKQWGWVVFCVSQAWGRCWLFLISAIVRAQYIHKRPTMYWAAPINVFILGPLCCVPLYFLSPFVIAVEKGGGGTCFFVCLFTHVYTHSGHTHAQMCMHTHAWKHMDFLFLSLSLFHNGGLLSMLRNSSPGFLVFGINLVM